MIRFALLVSLLTAATSVAYGQSSGIEQGAGEQVLVRQLAPAVTVRLGADRAERVLYYFSPTANLGQGDELEQGGAAHSSVALPEGGLVEMWASTHLVLDRLDRGGDVLRFTEVTSSTLVSASRPMVIVLPGGVRAEFQGTRVDVRLEPGMLRVRNRGETPVRLLGFLAVDREPPAENGEGLLLLERGQEAELPLFRETPPLPGRLADRWSELQLRHDGGFLLEPGSGSLVLRPSPEGGPVRDDISVGGVHTSLAGQRMLLVRSHRAPVLPPLHDERQQPLGATAAEKAGTKTITVQTYLDALDAGFSLDEIRLRGFIVSRAVIDEAERLMSAENDTTQAANPAETPLEQDG
ncbi:MAG: hypothetical protein DHS20C15_00590 [Planctomycetota bacterium]|nr:MAG: hypothetical protein DHS20C15_00590 [Planctomycetota bacterium]